MAYFVLSSSMGTWGDTPHEQAGSQPRGRGPDPCPMISGIHTMLDNNLQCSCARL